MTLNPTDNGKPDALCVRRRRPGLVRATARLVGRLDMPNVGDELHHFGWNACSAALCPTTPHPHVERRYLLVPGLRSSRIYILDTKPDPRQPQIVKTIEPDELAAEDRLQPAAHQSTAARTRSTSARSARPTATARAASSCSTTRPSTSTGRWEADRGPQDLAYDFWWHLGPRRDDHQRVGHAEHGRERRSIPELLLQGKYGHQLHVWDLRKRNHLQTLDLGAEQQMVLELRPSHDPNKDVRVRRRGDLAEGPLGLDLALAPRRTAAGRSQKVIEIPAEPADAALLPPALQPFGAVPPLVTDINLSLDDKFLYVSCWGTGEFQQYDVSDPFNPKQTGSVHLGGIVRKAAHPKTGSLNGGPQMVEVSRDGQRIYLTNSLYASWDAQFYPAGISGWVTKIDADPNGGMTLDPNFFVEFGDERPHQVRLEGGDSSSDSYCFPP